MSIELLTYYKKILLKEIRKKPARNEGIKDNGCKRVCHSSGTTVAVAHKK